MCAKLGIALIHSRPHQPEGRGKQERWFRTVRAQFLTRLTPADTQVPGRSEPLPVELDRGRISSDAPRRPGRPHPSGSVGPARPTRSSCSTPAWIWMPCSCSRPSAGCSATAP
ncbi:MAG: hypothetical protein MZW92_37735 [Comamonadaceae bacterium]|nr:hypothetical protein [Comamonadaceae bacterium]